MAVLYLLDTNILVHQVRRDAVGERIRKLYSPLLAAPGPLSALLLKASCVLLGFNWDGARRKRNRLII
jgi:hypothetical protein